MKDKPAEQKQQTPPAQAEADAIKNFSVPKEFDLKLIDLTDEQMHQLCTRLALAPRADTTADALTELGFRNDDGALSFIKDHIVWPATEQGILHTLKKIFASDESKSEKFFAKISSVTSKRALKLIAKTDSETDGKPFRHSQWGYLFPFQNGVLKIDSNGYIDLLPYAESRILFPASSINPHSLTVNDETVKEEYWKNSDFSKLTIYLATDPETKQFDENLHEAIMMGLAKTCHLNYNANDPCAVVFSEQTKPGQRNAGGTGKGILMQAISQFVGKGKGTLARIDGKNFDIKYAHSLQGISKETKVVWVDEAENTEEVLNALYTGLTEGFVVNPKNCPLLVLSPEESPKVVITTNSPGTGVNDSDLRRRFDVPITRWYNAAHQPIHDFGKLLFGPDWTEDEWNRFFMTIAVACSKYLQRGYSRGRMERCLKAESMLKQAKLAEIDEDLLNHFENSYAEKIDQGAEFEVIPSIGLESFDRDYPANRARVTNSQSYNNNLQKWLELKGWNIQRGDKKYHEGKQVRYVKAVPPKEAAAAPASDGHRAPVEGKQAPSKAS